MNKKKEIAPKLRFPEFTDKWQNEKLGSIFLSRQETGFSEFPLMSLTDECGLVPQQETNKKDNSNTNKSKYLRVCEGDIVYNTMRMWQGRCAYCKNEGIVSPAYTVCIPKDGCDGVFFYYYFKTYDLIQKFHSNSQGLVSDPLNLKFDKFASIAINYPIKKEEQKKIADCLSSIDELIDAESRNLKALEKYKKGLMQKLFPAEGKTLPEWRFPEFSDGDGWIKTSLSQICIMQAGKFINASEISDEQKNNMYPCYGGNGLRGYTLTHNCSGDHPLIGRQGALCGNVTFATGDFYATEHAIVVTANKNIDEKWLYYLLDYLQLNQYATGQAQPGLSVQTLEKVTAIYPGEVEEQKKIANCLSEIDAIIAEQSNKVERLKAHKKGLLQGLFPSLKEADV